jgi:transcriptional regulator with XRE-family HTH domain
MEDDREAASSREARSLKILRIARGLTQRQLAQRAGLAAAQVSRYETGAVEPRFLTLKRLLEALDLPMEALGEAHSLVEKVDSPRTRRSGARGGAAPHSRRAGILRDPTDREPGAADEAVEDALVLEITDVLDLHWTPKQLRSRVLRSRDPAPAVRRSSPAPCPGAIRRGPRRP